MLLCNVWTEMFVPLVETLVMTLLCFPASITCCPGKNNKLETWACQVKWSLKHDANELGLSPLMTQFLLSSDDENFSQYMDMDEIGVDDDDDIEDKWIVQGVPRRPLYKEIGFRLFQWNKQVYLSTKNEENFQSLSEDPLLQPISQQRFMVNAEWFGFQETKQHQLSLPPRTNSDIRNWIRKNKIPGILRILGYRDTIGSENNQKFATIMMLPSRTDLIIASRENHHPNSALTVAARARTKHAHRGKDGFFGIAKGSPSIQNQQTEIILMDLIKKATWMNLHSFGGLNDDDFAFEIRVAEGYGARWIVNDSSTNTSQRLRFRGFLEPQMEDGHEKGWKH